MILVDALDSGYPTFQQFVVMLRAYETQVRSQQTQLQTQRRSESRRHESMLSGRCRRCGSSTRVTYFCRTRDGYFCSSNCYTIFENNSGAPA